MNPEELREYAAEYWRGIDVDKYQPVPHGPPRTAEDLEYARKQLALVDELNRKANPQGQPHPSMKNLFLVNKKDGSLMPRTH